MKALGGERDRTGGRTRNDAALSWRATYKAWRMAR
jgi:hypothetical protein